MSDNKVAGLPSRSLNCSTAREQAEPKEQISVNVRVSTIRQYELDSIDGLQNAINADGFSDFDYEIVSDRR